VSHPPRKRALICGVSGQDGTYLAALLLQKGYEVFGTSRNDPTTRFDNHVRLGIADRVKLYSMSLQDPRNVLQVLRQVQPNEVYNLAGQSSVGLSFEQPRDTLDGIVSGTLNLLESIRSTDRAIRFCNASSGECFGNTPPAGANEECAFRPRSPYAIAKAAAHWMVVNYREAYGLHASNAILFNHESPLRRERFVTKKIVAAACRIARGSTEKLILGNVQTHRDWGWAPEYVDAMWRMLQQAQGDDFVIATGECHSLEEFVSEAFACLGFDWRDHTSASDALLRPIDVAESKGDASKAARVLGWRPQYGMKDVVRMMVRAEMEWLS
jgi:GDPmannose 4,6-dehydratase